MPTAIKVCETSTECATLIRELADVAVPGLECELTPWRVRLTGRVCSWHDKQIASETARRMFPERRVENQLTVVTPR